jgi:arylsulfatase A-like enzyme
MAGLFEFLDDQVGLDNCVVVFTADHGVAPIPERILALRPGFPAGRVDSKELNAAVTTALTRAYGEISPNESWFVSINYGFHLNPATMESKGIEAAEAARTVKTALEHLPYIEAVFTRDEILATSDQGDGIPSMVRRSYFASNDRDVVFVFKPYFIARPNAGTTHGSPHPYDTHVPMAWFGGGIPARRHIERVGVDDLAPTLSAILGIPPPASAQGRQLF